jgi:hypothetical protein
VPPEIYGTDQMWVLWGEFPGLDATVCDDGDIIAAQLQSLPVSRNFAPPSAAVVEALLQRLLSFLAGRGRKDVSPYSVTPLHCPIPGQLGRVRLHCGTRGHLCSVGARINLVDLSLPSSCSGRDRSRLQVPDARRLP